MTTNELTARLSERDFDQRNGVESYDVEFSDRESPRFVHSGLAGSICANLYAYEARGLRYGVRARREYRLLEDLRLAVRAGYGFGKDAERAAHVSAFVALVETLPVVASPEASKPAVRTIAEPTKAPDSTRSKELMEAIAAFGDTPEVRRLFS